MSYWPNILMLVCGGAIGFAREVTRKPAGLHNDVLIYVGAALFVIDWN